MKIIEVRDLVKKFGSVTAVDGISFDVEEGTCLGLLGPNGAGKTSTVRILECVSPANSGEAFVFGTKAGLDARSIRGKMGVVPQENDLDNDLSVWQNLALFAKFFDIKRQVAKERIDAQLEFMDLFERKKGRIDELSGGMKRRLLIARALLNEPKILILDEPTTGLDPQMRHMIWHRIRALKQQGLTIVLTTHYMEEAEQLCDRVLIMDKGRILTDGAPLTLTKEMIGSEVIEIRNKSQQDVAKILIGLPLKMESFGDTTYVSRFEHADVVQRLSDYPDLSFLRRPATLEDVFLKLTGRALNE